MLDRRGGYEYEDLLACARGELFGSGNAQLPLPPMLMFDRIAEITETGGEYGRGLIRAELDVKPDLWFFGCHFKNDPVMPGCLGLDAMWQMVGFYLGWTGGEYRKGVVRAELDVKPDLWFFGCHFKNDPVMPGCLGLDALWQMVGFFLGWTGGAGRGRALGLGELKLAGQVLPNVRKVVYNVDIKRVMRSKLVLGIADGWLSMDGEIIYRAKDLKVGLFKQGSAPA